MYEIAFMWYEMFWIYVERILVSEFCLKSAQNTPFIKILHSVTHKCPVFENFLPLCDPLKPPPCLPPLLPMSTTLCLPYAAFAFIYIYTVSFYVSIYTAMSSLIYTTSLFISYPNLRIPNIQVSNSKQK